MERHKLVSIPEKYNGPHRECKFSLIQALTEYSVQKKVD